MGKPLLAKDILLVSKAVPIFCSSLKSSSSFNFQLYGLELLASTTSSLTSMEKKKILDHLRLSFEDISSNANVSHIKITCFDF